MASISSSSNQVPSTEHGTLIAVTRSESSFAPEAIQEAITGRPTEKTVYVYCITERPSTMHPFEHRRLKSIWNEIEVVVLPIEAKSGKQDKIAEKIQSMPEVVSKIDEQVTTSLKSKLKSKIPEQEEVDEKMEEAIHHVFETDPSDPLMALRAKFTLLMGLNLSEISEGKKLWPFSDPESLTPTPLQQIVLQAQESNKELNFIEGLSLIPSIDDIDPEIFSFAFSSIILDPTILQEFISCQNPEKSDSSKERLLQMIQRKENGDQFISKFHKIDISIQQNTDEKLKECFASNKKTLMILPALSEEGINSFFSIYSLIHSISGEDVTYKTLREEPIGCFWKIKKDKITVGYLLGSIHLTPSYLSDLNQRIQKCYRKSVRLAVEIDITKKPDMSDSDLQARKIKEFQIKIDSFRKLTEPQQEQVINTLRLIFPEDASKIDWTNDKEKFIFILSSMQQLKSRIFENANLRSGIDLEMTKMSKSENKPVESLETYTQYNQLTEVPKDNEFELLLTFLASDACGKKEDAVESVTLFIQLISNEFKRGLTPMWNAWEEGNIEYFGNSENESPAHIADMMQRNLNMAKKIVDLLSNGERIFSCIGAAHTTGNTSVQTFLQGFGYTTERVIP